MAAPASRTASLDAEAALLLSRARQNLVFADHAAEVTWIRESFLNGTDTLKGRMDFLEQKGERRLQLSGIAGEIEWWARPADAQHWVREGTASRLRRLPAHSLRKPVLSGPASFEDLALLPLGYARDFRACLRLQETDSTYELTLLPRRGVASLYASIDLTLGKSPVLPRRIVFTGEDGRPPRTMEILRYHRGSDGYVPVEIRFFREDHLVDARILLQPVRAAPVRDHTRTVTGRFTVRPETYWETRDTEIGNGEDAAGKPAQ